MGRAVWGSLLVGLLLTHLDAALAQPCQTSGVNQTCTNSILLSGGTTGLSDSATATVANTATGAISGVASSSSNVFGISTAGDANVTNAGAIWAEASGGGSQAIRAGANANVTNSGALWSSSGAGPSVVVYAGNTANVVNSGTISATNIASQSVGVSAGDVANVTNWGTISADTSSGQSLGVSGAKNSSSANIVNHGVISATADSGGGVAYGVYAGKTNVTNFGTISGVALPHNEGYGILALSNANVTNAGVISGSTAALQFSDAADTLTLLPGSRIIGAINLRGGGDSVNFRGGSNNLTFDTLNGATVAGATPFVVVGNRAVSIDATPFAASGPNLLAFTGAISDLVGGRANAGAANAGGDSAYGPLAFASADAPLLAGDAFSQMTASLTAPDATWMKNPTAATGDGATFWARGFAGQRQQQDDGPVLRNVTQFYGGVVGMDRQVAPDLLLGFYAGGGIMLMKIDADLGKVSSDLGFGGLYGRKTFGAAFVDFGLLGGLSNNQATRSINNNLAANGLETATASYTGWFISPEAALGYKFDLGQGWSLTPTARARYLGSGFGSYAESGSTANLSVADQTLQNVEARGEAWFNYAAASLPGRAQFGFGFGVVGQQRVGGDAISATLLGQQLTFATPGQSSVAGGFVGATLDWRLPGGVAVFGGLEYAAMNDRSTTLTGRGGLRCSF